MFATELSLVLPPLKWETCQKRKQNELLVVFPSKIYRLHLSLSLNHSDAALIEISKEKYENSDISRAVARLLAFDMMLIFRRSSPAFGVIKTFDHVTKREYSPLKKQRPADNIPCHGNKISTLLCLNLGNISGEEP